MNPFIYIETVVEFKKMAREVCGTGKAVTIYPNGKILYLQNGKNTHKTAQDAQKIHIEIKQLSNLLKTIARIDNKYSKNFVSQMRISNYHNAYKLALHSVGRF